MNTLFIGVDPGESLGYCALYVPLDSRDPIANSNLAGIGTIKGTQPRKGETLDGSYVRHYRAIFDTLRQFGDAPTFVVERPSDGMAKWKNAAGEVSSRATSFTLGMRYGLVIAAAQTIGAAEIYSYPVTTNARARGWYPTTRTGNLVHAMNGKLVEQLLRSRISELTDAFGFERGQDKVSRDAVMSFGVLAYHIETGRHL